MPSFSGKSVIVTGATSGIGRAAVLAKRQAGLDRRLAEADGEEDVGQAQRKGAEGIHPPSYVRLPARPPATRRSATTSTSSTERASSG